MYAPVQPGITKCVPELTRGPELTRQWFFAPPLSIQRVDIRSSPTLSLFLSLTFSDSSQTEHVYRSSINNSITMRANYQSSPLNRCFVTGYRGDNCTEAKKRKKKKTISAGREPSKVTRSENFSFDLFGLCRLAVIAAARFRRAGAAIRLDS